MFYPLYKFQNFLAFCKFVKVIAIRIKHIKDKRLLNRLSSHS